MKRIITAIVLLIIAMCVHSQSLHFTKIMVGESGDVFLQWNYTGNENSFDSCVIEKYQELEYRSVATITDYVTNFWIDTDAENNTSVQKYRIMMYVQNNLTYVDSVESIYPDVSDISSEALIAFLIWNSPTIANTDSGYYAIHRKIQNKTDWQQINITDELMYSDTIRRSVCNDTIMYRILLMKGTDTLAMSHTKGSLFRDPMPTSPCSLEVITVTEDLQQIKLTWNPSPDSDIWGYFICQGNPCMALDTIYGKYNTSYIDTLKTPSKVYDYRIYAFDSCFTASALTPYYHNIVLKGNAVDCSNTIHVSWNEYINMPNGLLHYIVYVRYNDSDDFVQIGTINGDELDLEYSFDVPETTEKVEIKVVAIDQTSTKLSESNILVINLLVPNSAKFLYTRYATVNNDNSAVDLLFYVDTSFITSEYLLYRKENSQPYVLYDYIYPSGGEFLTYRDYDVDVLNKKYSYYLAVKDECGISEKKSNEVNPIFLILRQENNINCVIRTDYVGWDSVKYYKVYKKKKSDEQWQLLGLISSDTDYYCDDAENTLELSEGVCYKMVAYQGDSSNYMFRDSAQSPYVSFSRKGEVWVPNAFTPQLDNNNIFKPMLTFADSKGYHLQVYNRLGILMFETNDINQGWNGTYEGKYVQQGAYVYVVYCTFTDGTSYVQKGTVMVL